jgi:hypothetical protein
LNSGESRRDGIVLHLGEVSDSVGTESEKGIEVFAREGRFLTGALDFHELSAAGHN